MSNVSIYLQVEIVEQINPERLRMSDFCLCEWVNQVNVNIILLNKLGRNEISHLGEVSYCLDGRHSEIVNEKVAIWKVTKVFTGYIFTIVL